MADTAWTPIEGTLKKRRHNPVNTKFSKKRADHRNAILKDWAERLEPYIEPKVPEDYTCPFVRDKCVYCLSPNIGPSGDEFRPSTQRGRQNTINCVPCCGMCNSSKQDKCGSLLVAWIKERSPSNQQEIILAWYEKYEKYLLIPLDIVDPKHKKTYSVLESELDDRLNKVYEDFS
jgi:hypothetical protein